MAPPRARNQRENRDISFEVRAKRYYPPGAARQHGAITPGAKWRYNKRRGSRRADEAISMSATDTPNSSRPKLIRWIGLGVGLLVAVAAYFALNSAKHVPDATFTLLSGQKISTSDLKGKVYLVNFWATDCDTCVQEMPKMVQTYNRFKSKGLEFVAVAMQYDPPMYVMNYSQTRQLPFKVAMDDGSAAKQFGNVQLTPTTFLVDKHGRILKRYVGEPQFAELDQLLEKALGPQT
jgi:peroxiredoxin